MTHQLKDVLDIICSLINWRIMAQLCVLAVVNGLTWTKVAMVKDVENETQFK